MWSRICNPLLLWCYLLGLLIFLFFIAWAAPRVYNSHRSQSAISVRKCVAQSQPRVRGVSYYHYVSFLHCSVWYFARGLEGDKKVVHVLCVVWLVQIFCLPHALSVWNIPLSSLLLDPLIISRNYWLLPILDHFCFCGVVPVGMFVDFQYLTCVG